MKGIFKIEGLIIMVGIPVMTIAAYYATTYLIPKASEKIYYMRRKKLIKKSIPQISVWVMPVQVDMSDERGKLQRVQITFRFTGKREAIRKLRHAEPMIRETLVRYLSNVKIEDIENDEVRKRILNEIKKQIEDLITAQINKVVIEEIQR